MSEDLEKYRAFGAGFACLDVGMAGPYVLCSLEGHSCTGGVLRVPVVAREAARPRGVARSAATSASRTGRSATKLPTPSSSQSLVTMSWALLRRKQQSQRDVHDAFTAPTSNVRAF